MKFVNQVFVVVKRLGQALFLSSADIEEVSVCWQVGEEYARRLVERTSLSPSAVEARSFLSLLNRQSFIAMDRTSFATGGVPSGRSKSFAALHLPMAV